MNCKPIYLVAFFLQIFLFTTTSLTAQCTQACNGTTPQTANQMSMLANCEVIVVADDILEGADSCMTNQWIELRAPYLGIVASGMDSVVFNGIDFLDRTLTVKIMNSEGTSCWGYLAVVDKLPPKLECTTAEILCIEDTSPENTGYPIVTENCTTDIDLTYEDTFVENVCGSPYVRTITRTWHATDESGNAASCEQQILLESVDLQSITFPEAINLDCEYAAADTSVTGKPMLGNYPLRANGICDFIVSYSDELTTICGTESYLIKRSWLVINHCTGERRTAVQHIKIVDDTPPVFDCPNYLEFGTDNGGCTATIELPQITVTDNCSSDVTISVQTSYGASDFTPISGIETGWHIAVYTAVDGCGNRTTCEVTLYVLDDSPPQVACDDELNISIVGSNRGMLEAFSIADNSADNCDSYLLYSAARQDADSDGDGYPEDEDFVERVEFDCADVNETVPVVIRVTQADDSNLFTDCFVYVNVEDKISPIFDPIEDIYIDCTTDYSDLDIFPTPRVEDNCDFELATRIERDIDNCGVGEIRRIYTATDRVGNVTTRTQTIFVENQNTFDADNIIWPTDFTVTNNCNPELAPEDLPLAASEPRFESDGCELLADSYRDEVFEVSEGACLKIRRIWQVIDWCNYHPEDPQSGGIFTHTQILKVMDTVAPDISCPAQIRAGTNNDCDGGMVNIPIPAATDCSTDVEVTNDSPYAFANGADASGIYPVGSTTITYTAHDRCGNRSTCSMTIIVADEKAPTAICKDGVIGNLVNMNEQGMIMMDASKLDAGSFDNCTADGDLVFTIRRSRNSAASTPTTRQLSFNCDERGTQFIEFWVTDAAGNSAYCETTIEIQDNSQVCPSGNDPDQPGRLPKIGGKIQTPEGDDVESVMVKVNQTEQAIAANETDVTGSYLFQNVAREQTYSIIPERNDAVNNGVSTLDLIMISKHILGSKPLASPYDMIAADVNNSGSITTLDLINVRKVILQLSDEFPNNHSWRFIPRDYEFINVNNPCAEAFPEWKEIDQLMEDELNMDFIAIKIGDVNHSAIPNELAGTDERSLVDISTLSIDNQPLAKGESYQVPVYLQQNTDLAGLQFSFKTNEKVRLQNIVSDALTDLNETHFSINENENQLTLSYDQAVEIDATEPLFFIEIIAEETVELDDVLTITEEHINAELYDTDLTKRPLQLQFNATITAANDLVVMQNVPNPFSQQTTIQFTIPQAEEVNLSVFDVSGKLLFTQQRAFTKGQHEWQLSRTDLPQTGMLYYQMSTDSKVVTKKMLLLD
ncbi:MAG: HYR domain-containing protein [Saprospiraceae bacterium]